ncbi:hypothetical protein T03_5863 [Trichinella britovi]|uniref:Uncharacterized protein n=1 Tax=Trichinella britovi TaxID=45882 RepID=A0A0V0Z7C7_TRIBR|nr:hypothetical protein T03_5863 [Trichinella britovi]
MKKEFNNTFVFPRGRPFVLLSLYAYILEDWNKYHAWDHEQHRNQ